MNDKDLFDKFNEDSFESDMIQSTLEETDFEPLKKKKQSGFSITFWILIAIIFFIFLIIMGTR